MANMMLSELRRESAADLAASPAEERRHASARGELVSLPAAVADACGLTPSQWKDVQNLASSLSREQAFWVSGYLAALGRGSVGLAIAGATKDEDAASSSSLSSRRLTILYASETGNGAALADALAGRARSLGLTPVVQDIAAYKVRRLKDEDDVLIITSTHGEGAPPQPAMDFFEFIEGRKAPRLAGVRYAVLALGDSSYEHFCEAGKRLDRRLAELGAERLEPRVDCDVDFDEPAASWIEGVLKYLDRGDARATVTSIVANFNQAKPAVSGAAAAPLFDKRNPFVATVIDNVVLTGRGSTKETRHIELSLAGSGLAFAPGDSLGIMPRNDPAVVAAILSCLEADADASLALKGQATTLEAALSETFEITTATPRFLQHWVAASGARELERLSLPEHAGERSAFLRTHHIVDILRKFPVPGMTPGDFVAGLRPLQPRLYSIASSLAAMPEEVHLTVATVRYELHGEPRGGVASGHLADRGAVDTTLPVYVQPNPHFRLPAGAAPIIMIGAGTGVAPYRAFLQERDAASAAGRSWLIFGERNFRTDFLYQTEWQAYLKDGVLSRMNVAFSRDRAEKFYVQHRLREHARDVYAWLEEGAHLYVCGDAAHLAPDVHQALTAVIEEQGGVGREAAEDYLRAMQRDQHYQSDVY
jgi:sulfite reductase (NADPH) flavoprotein alpha-component